MSDGIRYNIHAARTIDTRPKNGIPNILSANIIIRIGRLVVFFFFLMSAKKYARLAMSVRAVYIRRRVDVTRTKRRRKKYTPYVTRCEGWYKKKEALNVSETI